MRKICSLFIYFGFIGFLVVSCAKPVREAPLDFNAVDFWKDQKKRKSFLGSLSSNVYLHYEWEEESISGNGKYLANFPLSSRLELRDPVGRLQFLMTRMTKNFLVFFPSRNEAFKDNSGGDEYFKKLLGWRLSFAEFEQLLLGILPSRFADKNFDSWEWDSGEGLFRAIHKGRDIRVAVWINPDDGAMRLIEITHPKGIARVIYKEFSLLSLKEVKTPANSVQLATHIELSQENPKARLEIDWTAWKPRDTKIPPSLFEEDIPKGTRVKLLK